MREFSVDKLTVKIFGDRVRAGAKAASDFEKKALVLLNEKENINVVFAAAPSQNETLAALCSGASLPWQRINAFHMDEYSGLTRADANSFGRYLDEHIFGKLPFRSVSYIGTGVDAESECERYARILRSNPPDLVIMGVGENGHIAFNDPWVADFNDEKLIKKVPLDEVCRMQQVHDKCFDKLDDVPMYALTMTIPALMSAAAVFCIVPGASKAKAVKETLEGQIGENCPATALRRHACATMYLDGDSSALLGFRAPAAFGEENVFPGENA